MKRIDGDLFGQLFMGTLVLNAESRVEVVYNLSMHSVLNEAQQDPFFKGEINGRPAWEYYRLPVTVPLLAALGWTLIDDKIPGVVIAKPPAHQFNEPGEENSFEIWLVLADNAIPGWERNYVVKREKGGHHRDVTCFAVLERLFFEHYWRRMAIMFVTDDFAVPA